VTDQLWAVSGEVNSLGGTLPWSQTSTAYNADWAMGVGRACYEGLMYYGEQSRSDTWGCVGGWWSGHGPGAGGESYERRVQAELSTAPTSPGPAPSVASPPPHPGPNE
jgi:hypothetical protein